MSESANLADGLRDWVTRQLGSPLRQIQPLQGSTTTSLHRIQTASERAVLRVFDNAEWLAVEPDLVPHEAAALQHAAGHAIATPELIAWEEDAAVCGMPVLLMSFLPGAIQITPPQLDDWLRQLASTLFHLHQIPAGDFGWAYRRWYSLNDLQTPRWSQQSVLWERMRQILSEPAPAAKVGFIHRDYHPTNLLFEQGEVSGVVDWINGCVGARNVDLAHCRNNLVCLYGVETADRFLAHYVEFAGGSDPDQPYWDLNGFAEFFMGDEVGVYPPWRDFGMAHLSDQLVQRRADAYLAAIMSHL